MTSLSPTRAGCPPKEKKKVVLRATMKAAHMFTVTSHMLPVLIALTPQLQSPPCPVSAAEAPLPHVSEATGSNPAWVITGDYANPQGTKTLWIFKNARGVRVTGRERASGAPTRFQRTGLDGPITGTLIVENTKQVAVRDAPLDTYAFITSYVFYPTAGCYEFDVEIEQAVRHIIVQVK
jgi:hypothetical protein